jgi:hypothetical protein
MPQEFVVSRTKAFLNIVTFYSVFIEKFIYE